MDLGCRHQFEVECGECHENRRLYRAITSPLGSACDIKDAHQHALLPTDPSDRKRIPVGTGVMDYFPAALAEIAKVSFAGNEQHNPGQPLHWVRAKSTDQADTIIRHFLERGKLDSDGMRHSAKLAWRALALLQLELEAEGAPIARGAFEPQANQIFPGAVIKSK